MPWEKVALIALGGAAGANARYWLGLVISAWTGDRFPWATFAINVSGSFLAGFLSLVLIRWAPNPQWRLLLITGLLGGYTTFSAFELEACGLWASGSPRQALAYLTGSVLLGFLAAALGLLAASSLPTPRPTARPPAVAPGPPDRNPAS